MPIDYQRIKNWRFEDIRHRYTERDVMFYALSIGLGQDPLDDEQLRFVYEKKLKVFPTIGSILAQPGFWMQDPNSSITWVKLVHGEQRMRFHKPFPLRAELVGRNRVTQVIDKGVEKGAIVVVENQIFDTVDDSLLATVEQVTFCRADGGFGISDPGLEPLPKVPERAPDRRCTLPTRPEAALYYRLNADLNPLHVDPEVAGAAGYPQPILHGLCTYGVAAHAVLRSFCNYDPARLARFDARFSAPVFPGETLEVEMWEGEGGLVQFQARVTERDVVVLSHGVAGMH